MATRRVYDPSGKGFYEEEISQYKADGLLDGCYVMQGRRCMIDVAAADERLRRNIDPGQPARKATVPTGEDAEIDRLATEWCDRSIYTALEYELPVKRAVKLAGIDYSTYRTWIKKGLDDNYPVHANFRRRVKKILASIEMKKLRTIQKAAEGYLLRDKKIKISKKGKTTIITVREIPIDWKAATWILERRFPDRYGKAAFPKKAADDSYVLATQVKSNLDALMDSIPASP